MTLLLSCSRLLKRGFAMNSLRRSVLVSALGLGLSNISTLALAQAPARASKEEAVAMVKKAVAFYKANGRDKTFAEVSDQSGQFRDRELFVVVMDAKANVLAHGALKKMIGANIMDLKDVNGVMIIRSMFKAVEKANSGWSDEYLFLNPLSKAMEPKLSYVEKFEDMLFFCGYHFLK
ncbi:cache domain-containing protein [Roseateles oligotrophus]|uniref:Cache domain-containing protein n=1 Tax=Roseateles oligotrophus TaxID=1769250 RepID=A0ABT2YD46_9BURK|nr:cache domain-containing protein [Roseateles oligotrophus]MCV2367965.1 cache domain-containing protein [Roseateles oligotrophus]